MAGRGREREGVDKRGEGKTGGGGGEGVRRARHIKSPAAAAAAAAAVRAFHNAGWNKQDQRWVGRRGEGGGGR